MTQHNLLNIPKLKQIVSGSQFWSTRWVRFSIGIKRLPRGQSSPPGQTNGKSCVPYTFSYLASRPFIWSCITVGYLYSFIQSNARKSERRASIDWDRARDCSISVLFIGFFAVWTLAIPPIFRKMRSIIFY